MSMLSYSASDTAVAYLERLLSFSLKSGARETAARIIARYGTLDLALSAPTTELARIDGMNKSAANLLALTAAVNSRRVVDALPVGTKPDVDAIYRFAVGLYLSVSVETVYLMLFDGEDKFISLEYIGEGTVAASDVYPRRLIEAAVKKGAASAILMHNHPRASGVPSQEDVNATDRIAWVFDNAGVYLRMHLVVSERSVARIPIDRSKRGY